MNSGKIAVIGLHHLGSVISICLAHRKKDVIGLDKKSVINIFQKKEIPFYEPGLRELLLKSQKNISFGTNFSVLKEIGCIFFTQDTETNGSGSIKKLEHLVENSIPYFKDNTTIILVSQVPIGTCRSIVKKIKKIRPNLKFDLYHWVDTLIMTDAINRFLKPERIIIGEEVKAQQISKDLKNLLKLFKCPVLYMSYESAEITKASINTYLSNSISFANTLSDFCEQLGGNIYEIIPALKMDKRIGPFSYLNPTLRISGGHLKRDLLMFKRLSRSRKIPSGIIETILKLNENRYKWVMIQLKKMLGEIKGSTISLWGLSYKKNSASTQDSPSIKLIEKLSNLASLNVYDPMAVLPKKIKGYKRFDDKYQALKGSDCLIILTDWDEFKTVDFKKIHSGLKNPNIIDCIGIFEQKLDKLNDFKYKVMGVGEVKN